MKDEYGDKDKNEILKAHLEYAKTVEKKFQELKNESEEQIQMLTERYNELVEAFEVKPARSEEDIVLIRQLTEENMNKEEVIKRMNDRFRSSFDNQVKKEDSARITNSNSVLDAAHRIFSVDKVVAYSHFHY